MAKNDKNTEGPVEGPAEGKPQNLTVPLTEIVRDPKHQFRTHTSPEWIQELKDLYKSGQRFTGEHAIKIADYGMTYYLYDGFHRYEVMKDLGVEECEVQVTKVSSMGEVYILAMQGNATHGKRFDNHAYAKMLKHLLLKRNKAKFMDGPYKLNVSLLAETMRCSEVTVRRLTKEQRDELTRQRDDDIRSLHKEGKTGKEIGKELGLPTSTVTAFIRKMDKEHLDLSGNDSTTIKPVATKNTQDPTKPEDAIGPEVPEGDAHRQIDLIEVIQGDLEDKQGTLGGEQRELAVVQEALGKTQEALAEDLPIDRNEEAAERALRVLLTAPSATEALKVLLAKEHFVKTLDALDAQALEEGKLTEAQVRTARLRAHYHEVREGKVSKGEGKP